MLIIGFPHNEDAEGMNEVIKASWYATYITPKIGVTQSDIDMIYAQNEQKQIESFKKRIQAPQENDITLIAKVDARVVGIIRLIHKEDIQVRTLYVHPDFTGNGIGTKLWTAALKYIPNDKDIIAFPALHTRSIEWYKKVGFIETGKHIIDDEAMPVSGVHLETIEMKLIRK